ncbi:hypothetical protein BGW39_000139 [Mortierella sp. 14UC]|nr:hypothetical protein BGW39_000139 [Mortierella sp. 14UC]
MAGILKTFPQNKHELKRQEDEYWQKLRQADNDRRSREATLQHLQPYIQTEQLRQQQQVQQLQQQYRLQQQLLSQQQKRLAEELEWLRQHQQKQAAAIERQQQQQQQKKPVVGETARLVQDDAVLSQQQLRERERQAALAIERQQQDAWNCFTLSKDHHEQTTERQQRQQPDIRLEQRQRQVETEQQQRRVQAELNERQQVEREKLLQLYKLRKQQEQQVAEQRHRLQQALLSSNLQQYQQQPVDESVQNERSCETDEVLSELMGSGPPCVQESNNTQQQPHVSSAPQPWNQALTTDNKTQVDVDAKDEDDASEEEDHPGHYNQQAQNQQYDWRGLRRISKAYVPMPRLKRGRKGRGDLFEDDYHAGFNKMEIQALSTAGKAAYEAQRQKRQQHEEPVVELE